MKQRKEDELTPLALDQMSTVGDLQHALKISVGSVPPAEQGAVQVRFRCGFDGEDPQLLLTCLRLETDAEYAERLAAMSRHEQRLARVAEAQAGSDRENRRMIYEQLRKEFGDDPTLT